MTYIARLGTLFLLAAALPFIASFHVERGESNCETDEFWYQEKNCCLPRGGPPSTPSPPKGHDCPPASHYWSANLGCCVPLNPPPTDQPPPQCRNGWDWYPALHMCLPQPSQPAPPPSHPSGGQHDGWKRYHKKSRSVSLCPTGLDACPISGLTSEYECLDTAEELESCGGCVSLGQGQDCTAIPGVWNVGCEQGRCAVYTCAAGFKRSHDGKSCIAL